jgi:predicted transcriptional regulator
MPTTPHPQANMADKPPSPKQLNYLKALAQRTGQTFTWPNTNQQASDEIARLKHTPSSTPAERAIERLDDRAAREAAQDAAIVHGFEVVGHGSSATWSQRS